MYNIDSFQQYNLYSSFFLAIHLYRIPFEKIHENSSYQINASQYKFQMCKIYAYGEMSIILNGQHLQHDIKIFMFLVAESFMFSPINFPTYH